MKKLLDREKRVETIYNHLRHLPTRINQRFAKAHIDTQAKQNARKRKKENCYKDAKEKRKRLVSKCVEVVQKFAPDAAKMHETTTNENVFSISLLERDIIETPALLPRFHLNALAKVIERGGEEDKALKFKRELLERQSKAKKKIKGKHKQRRQKYRGKATKQH